MALAHFVQSTEATCDSQLGSGLYGDYLPFNVVELFDQSLDLPDLDVPLIGVKGTFDHG
jgi:hypothetical protein